MPKPYSGQTAVESGDDCCISPAAAQLRARFRLLWEQHVYWTRMVIISIAFALPDLQPTTNRLLRNPDDFARLFARFYGDETAAAFRRLLREHLVIAVELVKAAKAGDSKAAAAAERKWYANADEIADFLSQINPHWSCEHMRAMWHEHLSLTKQEAVARLNRDYAKDIAIFDKIEKQAMLMADDFANGMIQQFDL